ncbi:hypothetical protein Hsw_1912 [Hymenobacter swuensis DY53]|uniref:Uncharacterized protein n=1 Tax=Hymenobacter swuensis DY53 TaxID=1227739 RepID=W8F0I4_9BACT|nr:hypothetical protein Hsw_1912 [Hymenobacter swuensis DY53]
MAACLLGLAAPGFAQTAPSFSDLSTARYDRSDTMRAVQHLFMQRSKATRVWLNMGLDAAVGATLDKAALAAVAAFEPDKRYYKTWQQQANGDMVMGSLAAAYGFYRLSRFGPQRYQRVMQAYAQGGPLPEYLQRRLKNRYFRLRPL